MKPYLLAHDLGTSGNKATLFDAEGRLVAARSRSYGTAYGKGNRAEQSPAHWWSAVCETSRAILESVGKDEIGAVCLSGQMMGCLCVDGSGRPLREAIIYSDQRATREAARLLEGMDADEFYRICGHRASASYSVEKLMWVQANEPEVYRATHKMLNAKDYVNYRLTGRYCTDHNDASGTNCFDINSRQWSQRIIDLAGIKPELLPEARQSTFVAGGITREAAGETGLAADTPVVIGAGDGGCATVGVGCVREGVSYNYLGSSSWISTASASPVLDPAMRTFTWVHPVPGLYQPCGTVQTAGSSVDWLAGRLFAGAGGPEEGPDPYRRIDREAAGSPPGSNGVLFLPHLLGERSPRWNPDAKGAWVGLKLSNDRADLARAVLEGVALNLEIVLSILRRQVPIEEMILIGGGARSELWRRILADVYGIALLIPEYLEEATSMGAAIIAGVGTGCFDFQEGARRFVRVVDRIEPVEENARRYGELKPVFDQCYTDLERTMRRL